MTRHFSILFVALVMMCVAAPLVAHHSFEAEYDRTKPITFTGTVTKIDWMNPHIWIYIDVKDAAGKITKYEVEGDAPNSLIRKGWRLDTVKPGDMLTVRGSMAKNGSNHVNQNLVTFADGRTITGLGSGSPGLSAVRQLQKINSFGLL